MSKVIEQRLPCPVCPSSDAFFLYDDGHGFCYSCEHFKPAKEEFLEEVYTYEYLPHRGLSKRTLELYDIKAKVDKDGKPISVGFRYPWGDIKERFIDKKEFRWSKSDTPKHGLFGRDKFSAGSQKSVTITEGEYDAPSVYEVTSTPAVSVTSSSSAVRDVIADRAWVDSFDQIILALDADEHGRKATKEIAKLFDYNKVLVVDFDRRKDANEYLLNGEADELKRLWMSAKRYLPETIVEVTADAIDEILGEEPKQGVPYPFQTLNEMTYGIRRGESVLITAQEGVGKTQLMHAIEYQLLKETDDAIGAIFLEEDKRDHLYALAGIHLKKPAHLPDSGVTKPEVHSAIVEAGRKDGRIFLYNHFGSDDPDVLLDTIRFMVTARNVVYVLLDHIGISVSGLKDGGDERRALDYLSTRLAMMIKELNFALIMVSHVNDNGLTRGSRLIGKDCHVRINATRNVEAVDEKTKNTINLMVSKNRPIGRTGFAGGLLFDQYTRQFQEIGHD